MTKSPRVLRFVVIVCGQKEDTDTEASLNRFIVTKYRAADRVDTTVSGRTIQQGGAKGPGFYTAVDEIMRDRCGDCLFRRQEAVPDTHTHAHTQTVRGEGRQGKQGKTQIQDGMAVSVQNCIANFY